jgi:hypothetical protein
MIIRPEDVFNIRLDCEGDNRTGIFSVKSKEDPSEGLRIHGFSALRREIKVRRANMKA